MAPDKTSRAPFDLAGHTAFIAGAYGDIVLDRQRGDAAAREREIEANVLNQCERRDDETEDD